MFFFAYLPCKFITYSFKLYKMTIKHVINDIITNTCQISHVKKHIIPVDLHSEASKISLYNNFRPNYPSVYLT